MSITATPHDAVFKKYLSHPATARGYLQIYLPDKLFQQCDNPSLNSAPDCVVGDNLCPYYAEIHNSMPM